MEIFFIIVVLVLIYIVSFRYAYKWVRKQHLPGGEWDLLEPDVGDVVLCVVPLVNLIIAIEWGIESLLKNKYGSLSKFFKLK